MKKISIFITTIIVVCLMCSLMASASGLKRERCPLCGAEDSFVYYSKDYGYCYKCHKNTDTTLLKIYVKSSGSASDKTEITIYHNGKIERLSCFEGSGWQEFWFETMQQGFYTVVVTKKDHVPISYNLWVRGKEQTVKCEIRYRGDVNGDGVVNMTDYHAISNHVSFVKPLYGYAYQCADINGDWRVDYKDVKLLDELLN